MPKDPNPVGSRLKRLRLEKGLTQAQVGGGEFTEAYVSMIESGRRKPSPAALEYLASRVGVDATELLTGRPRDTEVRLELQIHDARRQADETDVAAAEATLKKVLKEARQHGLTRLVARALEVQGLIAERRQGAEEALRLYRLAEEAWNSEPLHLKAETMAGIARCTRQLETPLLAVHGLDTYRKDLEAAGQADPSALMRICTALIYPYFAAGLPEKAVEVARLALTLESRVDNPEDLACMHMAVARSLVYDGAYDDALQSIRKAEDVYLAGGWKNRLAKARINEAIVLAKKESYDSALEKLESALAILDESPDRLDQVLALNEMAYVMRHLGDIDAALGYLDKARPLLNDSEVIEQAFNARESGLCLAGRDPDVAEKHLKRAIDLYRISRDATELATTFKALGELYMSQGRAEDAFRAACEGIAAVEERSA